MADESYFRGYSGTSQEAADLSAARAVVQATYNAGGYASGLVTSLPTTTTGVPTGERSVYAPREYRPQPVLDNMSLVQMPNLSNVGGIADALLKGLVSWDQVIKMGAVVVKALAAMGVQVPAWVLAAVGLAGALDVATPGGLITAVPGGFDIGVTGPGILYSTVPGIAEHGGRVVKYWKTSASTLGFVLTATGWIAAARKDGTWRWYKPQRPIVLTRSPSLMTVLRADGRLNKITKRIKSMITRRH